LQSRWAKDVRPDLVLPEYPRPQDIREERLSLNAPWQLDAGLAAIKLRGRWAARMRYPLGKNVQE
jgi:hypothetical protein